MLPGHASGRVRALAAALVALATATPLSSASHDACATNPPMTLELAPGVYFHAHEHDGQVRASLWLESNGFAGLQIDGCLYRLEPWLDTEI